MSQHRLKRRALNLLENGRISGWRDGNAYRPDLISIHLTPALNSHENVHILSLNIKDQPSMPKRSVLSKNYIESGVR
jgi:hypothetical protein